ncbi:C1 family peptidase [Streptomyces sp. PTM05]|uniref:C1 family peptidase n=1 Tax=Streptantibioticus parmotrematis TaxID=2873249 RepID=A0ABS7QLV3_9ACTN|nr:C1 family peptidase [Streptantibioticus parmotrematis]MBY8884169.1 C1 family peptidase [Streptantibioticus parmotrematis]
MRRKTTALLLAAALGGGLTLTAAPMSFAAGPAAATAHHHYALGARLSVRVTHHTAPSHAAIERSLKALSPLRSSMRANDDGGVDLSQYAASPGDQGQVGSCVAWAIDHSAYSVEENEQGISGGPQAPMYTYAQIAQGNDQGSTPEQNFQIAESQGVDADSDYSQGDYDYTTQPTQAETDNAANWKLSGHTSLSTGSGIQSDVEQALSNGEPVVITIPVYKSFEDITAQQATDYSYAPTSGDQYMGDHEITIIGYNDQGVRVENSWGTSWGDQGFINLSWDYLSDQVKEANAVGKLVQN